MNAHASHLRPGFHGPLCWGVSALGGCAAGALVALAAPAPPTPALWLCIPFAALLVSIALVPFASASFWHRHYPDFSFALGGFVLAYSVCALGSPGRSGMVHAAVEYFQFIALVGGLYVASGGILINLPERRRRWGGTLLLGVGAALANVLGTTGASVLLIRPFMRMNRGRLRPIHAVFFILIVSNCGGVLTPIGDPPLYLGYLKGVPFFWTLERLWPSWLLVNGLLLGLFYLVDSTLPEAPAPAPFVRAARGDNRPPRRLPVFVGGGSMTCVALLVAGVFIDPWLARHGLNSLGVPYGAIFQSIMAVIAYATAPGSIRRANGFTFDPLREVGLLFIGIFITMAPALSFLQTQAPTLGLVLPTQYYFLTGSLSAVLDNAPTYASLLQVAMGIIPAPMSPEGVRQLIAGTFESRSAIGAAGQPIVVSGASLLAAISSGAVFFGALTYIGNGPNFMVRSMVESAWERSVGRDVRPARRLGAAMPSFFDYTYLALLILFPILVVNWLLFVR